MSGENGLDAVVLRADRSTPARARVEARERDQRVTTIVDLMVGHSWNEERSAELADEWGVAEPTMRDYAANAAMFIRLCRDPDKVQDWGLTKLNRLAEDMDTPAAVKVAAIKVALDATQPRAKDAGKPTPALDAARAAVERNERIRDLLRNPPPELVAMLEEEWGPRTVMR